MNQTGYNFHPNDRLYYFDTSIQSYKAGSCYQVEIKIFIKPDASVETKLVYLISIDDNPNTLRVDESTLRIPVGDPPILTYPPSIKIYNETYDYAVNQNVWVIDRVNSSVRYATVAQAEIKIYTRSNFTSETKITYHLSYTDNTGSVKAKSEDVFATSEDAWAALGVVVAPAPTPTPTGDTGGSTNLILVSKINTDSIVLYKGMAVYIKSDGTISRVKNDITTLRFLGFVYDDNIPVNGVGRIITEGTINNTNQNWNNTIEGGGTLQSGSVYYIGGSLGKITTIAPTSGYSKQIGMAASETELDIRLMQTIKIS